MFPIFSPLPSLLIGQSSQEQEENPKDLEICEIRCHLMYSVTEALYVKQTLCNARLDDNQIKFIDSAFY